MICKCKKKKKRKLANLLLRNYIISYIIMTLVVIISIMIALFIGVSIYLKDEIHLESMERLMKDDYTQIDTSSIEKINGYIVIIDKNNNVIFSKGKLPEQKTSYSAKDYISLIDSSAYNTTNSDYSYKTMYNYNKNFLLVVAIPKNSTDIDTLTHPPHPGTFVLFVLAIDTIVLGLFFIIYSRISSKNFVKPLKKLMEGVRKFSDGDLSTRIDVKSENEFGELRDAFNSMAEKLQLEQESKNKLQEMNRRLVLDISHDLKNPLSIVLGYSDLIMKNSDLSNEDQNNYLKIIYNNSSRANMLIQDLFELSKLQSTDFKLQFQYRDICEFLREIIASYIPELEEHEFIYDFIIPEEPYFLNIDEKHLNRALSNLISNSIKYNGPKTELKIEAFFLNDIFEINIKDNGIGIPKSLQTDIFHPFVRVDSSRNSKSGGSGLGLAITKDIIEKHNGVITLESDENKGCLFKITFHKK